MQTINEYQNKQVLVLGLAKSGFAVAKLLKSLGAQVLVNEGKALDQSPQAQELVSLGYQVIAGSHPLDLITPNLDYLVKNPGIPYSHPLIVKALEENIPVITEIEVAASQIKGTLIGITGSNGKTTTTSLVQAILEQSLPQRRVFAVGNIGLPLSQMVEDSREEDIYVVELSSFQLMGIRKFHPHIAAILNIYSAHLDYHGSQENYQAAKLQLLSNLAPEDKVIYPGQVEWLHDAMAQKSPAQMIPFGAKAQDPIGVWEDDQALYIGSVKVLDKSQIKVPGHQNIENIMAAIAIAWQVGATIQGIQKAVSDFHGVKHRTQFVKEWQGRRFYNDSKATNIVATQTAIASFPDSSLILVAGGLDRGNGFEDLVPDLQQVKAGFFYGQTKEKLQTAGRNAQLQEIGLSQTLDQALAAAIAYSQEGDTILFSPACASWDQYDNFEVRGDHFIQLLEDYTKE